LSCEHWQGGTSLKYSQLKAGNAVHRNWCYECDTPLENIKMFLFLFLLLQT